MSLTLLDPGTDHRDDEGWVLAAPFRAHLRHLVRTTGVPWRALALAADVEPTVVRSLLHGRAGRPMKRLHHGSARQLLQLTPESVRALEGRQVDAGAVTQRLQELVGEGIDEVEIAECLRLNRYEVAALAAGSVRWCTALTALLVEALTRARASHCLAA